ncbi:MAG: hypothetical protein DMG13_27625 [Acidobacteria bacterium]|nr:MAG: hypothetical protein DMG13_27625 [Acidobacteriota bacterium]
MGHKDTNHKDTKTQRLCVFVSLWLVFLCSFATSFAAPASDVADAAMNKNVQAVRSLLQQKADVNAPQTDGTTALHWAARWDDLEMAGALIRDGANAQAANRDGATPMFLATVNGSAAMIETLRNRAHDGGAHRETGCRQSAG